jgi:predicted Ser/Thr protein kinase
VSSLKVEAPDDLQKKLRENGYSESAVDEILKWYKKNNDKKT